MKILDVSPLDNGIEQTLKDIQKLRDQLRNIQKAVSSIVSLEDSFTGKAGESIRSFYAEYHEPFLLFFNQFLSNYETILHQMRQSVSTFESSRHGFIRQTFLENDVQQGLEKVSHVVKGLVNEANKELDKIQHIVSISNIDESDFISDIQHAKHNKNEVIEQLHALDQSQTEALAPLKSDISTMKNYITEIGSLFQNGSMSIQNFDKLKIQGNDAYEGLMETVLPIQTAMKKLENLFSYIAPVVMMLVPSILFPITYRDHSVSQTPPNFDRIKETAKYQQLTQESTMSEEEVEAIRKYLLSLDTDQVDDSSSMFNSGLWGSALRKKYTQSGNGHSTESVEYHAKEPITFWDKRLVMGGNSSLAGTPDGLGGISSAVGNFFIEDIATIVGEDATLEERLLAAAFTFGKPLKAADAAYDAVKGINSGKKVNVDDFNTEIATNKQKGNFGEIKSNDNLLNNQSLKDAGYDLKPIGRDAPSSINDKIVKGIDGLYENASPNSKIKYVIDEAKFGSGQLSKTKDGKQMSDNWLTGGITGKNRILQAVKDDELLARNIQRALEKGQVERVLSKIDNLGNVKTFRIDINGNIIGEWP